MTSPQIAAYEKIQASAPTLRQQVLEFVAERRMYGATDEEIQMGLDMAGNTQRPRRRELVQSGQLRRAYHGNGDLWTRNTRSGRAATVWILGDERDGAGAAEGSMKPVKDFTEGMKHGYGGVA